MSSNEHTTDIDGDKLTAIPVEVEHKHCSITEVASEIIGAVADAQAKVALAARDMMELQEAVLENMPDAQVVIDEHGKIVMVNQQTEFLFGYPRDQMIGQQVEMLLPERFRNIHLNHRAAYSEDLRTRQMGSGLCLYGRRISGTEIAVEIMLAPIVVSRGSYTIAVVRRHSNLRSTEECQNVPVS
jgi:PAS domain S-box-containing protein